MFGVIYTLHQVSELYGFDLIKDISDSKKRSRMEILIIDDDSFPFADNLRKIGFRLTEKKDIEDIQDVQPYQIVLCDINGVGKTISSSHQGAYLSQQIKIKYPEKYVVVYSADPTKMESQKYLNSVDKNIPKGTSLEDWSEILDEAINELVDPVSVWKKTSLCLFRANVSTKDIAILEDRYVRKIKKKRYDEVGSLVVNYTEALTILASFVKIIKMFI